MTCVYHCIRVTCQVIHRSPFLFGQFMEIHFISLGLVSLFLRVSYFFVLISAFEKRYLCLLYRLAYTGKYLHQSSHLQYVGHLMQRANSFEKTLMLGKIEGRRRRR